MLYPDPARKECGRARTATGMRRSQRKGKNDLWLQPSPGLQEPGSMFLSLGRASSCRVGQEDLSKGNTLIIPGSSPEPHCPVGVLELTLCCANEGKV